MLDLVPSVLFLFGLIAFGLIVIWILKNDGPGITGGFSGLLAMRSPRPRKSREDSLDTPGWKRTAKKPKGGTNG